MYLCYIDESGDVGRLLSTTKDSQPAFILLGLILPQQNLRNYTTSFVDLKKKYFPNKCPGTRHDAILAELKGSDLRQAYTKKNTKKIRHHSGFLSDLLKLITDNGGKIVGRAYIKEPDGQSNPDGIYTYSTQQICKDFQHYLEQKGTPGLVISDSRNYQQNNQTSHAIFTQMYKYGSDAYPNIVDMPTFGDSRNHAGIQTADLIASALLFPMAVHAYCLDKGLRNTHIQPKYRKIREEFHTKLAQLQYRYFATDQSSQNRRIGGITVSDSLGQKHGRHLFSHPDLDGKPSNTQLKRLTKKFGSRL